MTNIIKHIFFISFFILFHNQVFAQLDSVMNDCEKYLTDEYISDGQQYISLLTSEQTAEFNVLFYAGNTYRIISCGGNNKDLIFIIYDKDRNEIFNNSDYDNTAYWDIQFESTIKCFIEAKLAPGYENSGFAVLLIGLKNE
ncbi:MAG: hypothetical protein L3J35_11465 [Bacteroidales bacterium]|nr:hypothetical protein [Bacteroidales bacterium]